MTSRARASSSARHPEVDGTRSVRPLGLTFQQHRDALRLQVALGQHPFERVGGGVDADEFSLMRRCSHTSRVPCHTAASGSLAAVGRLFGTDGVRGLAGHGSDARPGLRPGSRGRRRARAPRRRPADVPDRPRHPALGRVAGGGARGRHPLGRRRRDPGRGRAHTGDRVPHDGAPGIVGRGHLRLAQPARGQRHQVLLPRRDEAVRRPRGRDRGGARRAGRARRRARHA